MGAMAEQDVVSEIGSPRIGLEDVDVARLGMAALRLIRVVEHGDVGKMWDAASALLRRHQARDAFIASITSHRRALGWGMERRWTAARIDRPRRGPAQPPGTYAVLESATYDERWTLRRRNPIYSYQSRRKLGGKAIEMFPGRGNFILRTLRP